MVTPLQNRPVAFGPPARAFRSRSQATLEKVYGEKSLEPTPPSVKPCKGAPSPRPNSRAPSPSRRPATPGSRRPLSLSRKDGPAFESNAPPPVRAASPAARTQSVDWLAADVSKERSRGDFSAGRWRTECQQLKVELNKMTDDARKSRQRIVLLEGDLQGKLHWMHQWENECQAAANAHQYQNPDGRGPGGNTWTAWGKYVDRAITEAVKTQRLLAGQMEAEELRLLQNKMMGDAQVMSAALSECQSQLETVNTENAKLKSEVKCLEEDAKEAKRASTYLETLKKENDKCKDEIGILKRKQEEAERKEKNLSSQLQDAKRSRVETPMYKLTDMVNKLKAEKKGVG